MTIFVNERMMTKFSKYTDDVNKDESVVSLSNDYATTAMNNRRVLPVVFLASYHTRTYRLCVSTTFFCPRIPTLIHITLNLCKLYLTHSNFERNGSETSTAADQTKVGVDQECQGVEQVRFEDGQQRRQDEGAP